MNQQAGAQTSSRYSRSNSKDRKGASSRSSSSSKSSYSSRSSYSSHSSRSRSSSKSSFSSRSGSRSSIPNKRRPVANKTKQVGQDLAPKGKAQTTDIAPAAVAPIGNKALPGRQVTDVLKKAEKAAVESDKGERKGRSKRKNRTSSCSSSGRSSSGSSTESYSSASSNASDASKSSQNDYSGSSSSSSDSEGNQKPKNKAKQNAGKVKTGAAGTNKPASKEDLRKSIASAAAKISAKRQATETKGTTEPKKQKLGSPTKNIKSDTSAKSDGSKANKKELLKEQVKLMESALQKKKNLGK